MRETGAVPIELPAGAPGGGGADMADLYREQSDGLRRVAYLMTGAREAADEIVHDAFVRVHDRWASLDTPGAYLHTTVVHLCLDWQRRRATERRRTPHLVEPAVAPHEIDETWDELALLPQDQRVVLVLRFYEDLPVGEIARIVGCPAATVRTRIHRAIGKLRREMTA